MAMIGNALDETASRGIGRLSIKDLAFLFVSYPLTDTPPFPLEVIY